MLITVKSLRDAGFNWRSISNILGMNERTLRNRRQTVEFQELSLGYFDVTDDELDQIVRSVMEMTPACIPEVRLRALIFYILKCIV